MKSERRPRRAKPERPKRPERPRDEYEYNITSQPLGSFRYRVHVYHLSDGVKKPLTEYGRGADTMLGAKWIARKIARSHSKAKKASGRIRV